MIGATGKGCSVALVSKIKDRGKGYQLFQQWLEERGDGTIEPIDLHGVTFTDTQSLLHRAYDFGDSILIEGTQGSLLDFHLGPYPYTTHKQTIASQWVTECGLAPGMLYETILVARTYPIRVAGNSGPLSKEITWPNLARTINTKLLRHRLPQRVRSYALVDFETALHELAHSGKYSLPGHLDGSPNFDMHKWTESERVTYSVALSELNADTLRQLSGPVVTELMYLFELTTVTKKLRRIAEWDGSVVGLQCVYNRASHVVVTFFNYWFPETWAVEAKDFVWIPEYKKKLQTIEEEIECKVSHITTGPGSEHVIPTIS